MSTETRRPYPIVDPAERFWAKIHVAGPDECWLWTAKRRVRSRRLEYGLFSVRGKNVLAHRFAYELLIGPIPEGAELDHVKARGCTSTLCVNPAHLEPVTHRANILRGEAPPARAARATHCPKGHPYSGENLYLARDGTRACRRCNGWTGTPAKREGYCKRGHELTDDNVWLYGPDKRYKMCRACARLRRAEREKAT